jgi:enoyl-CoA hydratase/carnithine racemase
LSLTSGSIVSGPVCVTRVGSVAAVIIRRPAQRNTMTLAMWRDMAAHFERLGCDPEVRAIVLTGAGGDFSAGADISEFSSVRSDARQSADYEVAVDACSDAIQAVPKPVIAAIKGYCLGGGYHLAMACDFRFAEMTAKIGIPAARLSIVYGVRSTQRLFSLVGLSNAKRILFSAERFDASEALRMGFIDEEVEDALEAAMSFAQQIAVNAPFSIAGAKAILNGLAMGPGALDLAAAQRLIDEASESADYTEGQRAFAQKRAPRFRGA